MLIEGLASDYNLTHPCKESVATMAESEKMSLESPNDSRIWHLRVESDIEVRIKKIDGKINKMMT